MINFYSVLNILYTAASSGTEPTTVQPETTTGAAASGTVSEAAGSVLKYFTTGRFLITLIAIILTILAVVGVNIGVGYYMKQRARMNPDSFNGEHRTVVHVIRSVLSGVIIVIAVIFILQVNGIQVSSLITSASIISAILGLALQDTIKDIIQGIQILSNKFYKVGDVIKYDNVEGIVTNFTLRSTKIYDIKTLNEVTIANRNLSRIEKLLEKRLFTVQISYDEPVTKMFPILEHIASKIEEAQEIKSCKFVGLSKMDESAMVYMFRMECDPRIHPSCQRIANRIICEELDKVGIKIPYNQLDVHFDPDVKIQ